MRKRKEKPENKEEEEEEEEGNGFYACYLLTSLCPRFKGHTYIGFTVNPKRRIRQHNGEIGCGAWRTKRKRPWEMVCCIYGFPTNVSALQFEWAWQHPIESLAVRKAASTFKSLSGISNKLKLAYTMLTLPSWSSLNISINYFSTKYMKNAAGCPSLPEHMKIQVTPINELPCYVEGDQDVLEKDDDWEYNRDSEVTFSFQASGSTQEETSTSMPKEFMDYHTGDDGISCVSDKEFEDNEQEPPTSFPSSIGSTSTSETEVIIEDKDTYISELNYMNLQQPGKKNSTPGRRTTEISKLSSSNDGFPSEYEIIDVSTPSPDCRTSSQRYKRRVTSVRSEIIDLTKSPTFIQL